MSQTLEALERLQEIDTELDSFAGTTGDAKHKVAELEAALAKARAAADTERGRVADAERARGQVDRELAEEKERLKKWDGRIVQAKHQKDFTALQREAEGLRKSIAAKDEAMAKQKLLVEETKIALRNREAEAAAKVSELEAAKANLAEVESSTAARVAELTAKRDAAKGNVPADLLGKYEAIRRKRPGQKVLVPAANGSCTGCNRKIQPAIFQRLMFTGTVELCPACSAKLIYARLTPAPTA